MSSNPTGTDLDTRTESGRPVGSVRLQYVITHQSLCIMKVPGSPTQPRFINTFEHSARVVGGGNGDVNVLPLLMYVRSTPDPACIRMFV